MTIAGMTSRVFQDIPNLHEVECSGNAFGFNMKIISLKIVKGKDTPPLASVNVLTNTCLSYSTYSSCILEDVIRLKILINDMNVGEKMVFGCHGIAAYPNGDIILKYWNVTILGLGETKLVLRTRTHIYNSLY